MAADCRGASTCQSDATIGLKGAMQPRDYSWGGKGCRVTDCTCRQTSQAEVNGADVSKALIPGEMTFLW